ncbi:MAG TPA: hypothetical protein VIN61_04965 [Gammaproteobacteria bacterium]
MRLLPIRASYVAGIAMAVCAAAGCSSRQPVPVVVERPAFCANEPDWRVPSCPCGCVSSLCISTEAVIGKTSGTLVCDPSLEPASQSDPDGAVAHGPAGRSHVAAAGGARPPR